MKTIFKSALLFAATTALFSSCVKDNSFENENSIEKTIIVTATASAPNNNDTRVSVGEKDGNTYPFYWNEDDKLSIYSYYLNSNNSNTYIKSLSNVAITVSEDNTKATFSFEDTAKESTKYTYRAGYPSAKVTNIYDNTQGKDAVCILDDVQIPTATSVDPNAVLLFAETETEIQGDDITFTFEHIVAYGKMTVTGPSAANGETVKSVTLSTDQNIAGYFNYYWAEQPVRYDIRTPKTSITTDLSAQNIDANSVFTVWFAVLPSSTSNFSITIETDEHTYTKTISGKSLTFLQGRVSTFNVDMASIQQEEKPEDDVYTRVTSSSAITSGNYIFLAEKDGQYYIISNENNTSSAHSAIAISSTRLTYEDDILTGDATDYDWTFAGDISSMTITSTTTGGYLYATNANNGLRVGNTSDSWTISPDGQQRFYVMSNNQKRYLSLYDTQDWRVYTNTDNGVPNIIILKKDYTPEPELNLDKDVLTFAAKSTAAQTIALEVVNPNKEEIKATLSGTNADAFKAEVENLVVTVTPNNINETESELTATLTVSLGSISKTVEIKQSASNPDEATTSTFVITSGGVVSAQGYNTYTNEVDGRDWIITYGGNNYSLGTNSNNRSNCTLSSYSKYAVNPVTTSSIASAFANTTSISDVSKIEYTFNGGSNQTNTRVYLLYSQDGNTFSQMNLTSGEQGATISSGTAFEFEKCSGYFAVLFEATNNSGNWRIDYVELTFTYIE